MVRRGLLTMMVAGCLLWPAVQAQQSASARGRFSLDRALAALGGLERLAGLDRWVVSGKGRENLSAELQGRVTDAPTWRDHEETIALTGDTVAWERRTPRNDLSLRWRRFIYGRDASGFIDWNAGRGRLAAPGTPEAERRAMARRIPHVLLREIAAPGVELRWVAEQPIDDVSHDVVEVLLPGTTPLRMFIARDSGTIGRLEYDAFLPGLGDSVVRWTWRGWTKDAVAGLRPRSQTIAVGDVTYQEVTFERFDAGARDVQSFVALPATLKASPMNMEAPPAAAGPPDGEVAPGVHVRNIQGFNVMVIAGPDGVVVVEAPEFARGLEAIPASNAARAGRVAIEQRDWLRSAFPGKPVRYVVVSHHHGDHIGGIALVAEPGSTVLSSSADAASVRHALDASRRLAPWPQPSAGGPRVRVDVVDGRRTLDIGRPVEIISTGDNPHSADNLLVWLPDERILFQGDLFYFDEHAAFPPAGREAMNRFFARWLAGQKIQPRAVYGVHNSGAAGPDALSRMLK